MKQIPKEILERCTFYGTRNSPPSELAQITSIKPIEDCPCGRELTDIRRVRLARTKEPQPHWREYCSTCKLVSVLDANDWKGAHELNAEMRHNAYWEDK